jgi:transposase-like protein
MKTTKDTNKRKQKQYRATQKVAIIREHLLEKKPVSDICDDYGYNDP